MEGNQHRRWIAWFVIVPLAFALSCAASGADPDPTGIEPEEDLRQTLAAADRLYDRWNDEQHFDFEAYGASLEQAIGFYEDALLVCPPTEIDSLRRIHNRLAQAYFEWAVAYLPRELQEGAFVRGRDHALASLRLDATFLETEQESFRRALEQSDNLNAVFWYGNNLGSALDFHPLAAITGGGMRDTESCYERALELDPSYLGGAPLRSLGSFLAQVPAFLGGDPARAADLFARSIEIAPDYAENYVNYAEHVAKPNADWPTFCSLLQQARALSEDAERFAEWPLYNTLAVGRIDGLIDIAADGPSPCSP
ncbi:hypothetical protein JW848_03385 [Candidatus Bipolaricaulota bacterium]|nr:hypothetical protein [Candidatus Bipolaricaulota bacterium]